VLSELFDECPRIVAQALRMFVACVLLVCGVCRNTVVTRVVIEANPRLLKVLYADKDLGESPSHR
jgi:hypothetical protein